MEFLQRVHIHVKSILFQVNGINNDDIYRLHIGYRLSTLRRLQLPSVQLRLLSEASASTMDMTKIQSATLETASANQSGSSTTGESPKRKKPKVSEIVRFDK